MNEDKLTPLQSIDGKLISNVTGKPLDEIPEMKMEDSIWWQFTKDEKMGQQQQGFRVDVVNGKRVKIPHISFSSDLDHLDALINKIVKKVSNLK